MDSLIAAVSEGKDREKKYVRFENYNISIYTAIRNTREWKNGNIPSHCTGSNRFQKFCKTTVLVLLSGCIEGRLVANLAKTEETSQRVITCSQLLHFDPNSKLMENLRKISPIPTINLAQVLVYSQSGRYKQCTLSITEDFISKVFFIYFWKKTNHNHFLTWSFMLLNRPSKVVNRPPNVPAVHVKSNEGRITSQVSDCKKNNKKKSSKSWDPCVCFHADIIKSAMLSRDKGNRTCTLSTSLFRSTGSVILRVILVPFASIPPVGKHKRKYL